MSSRDDATVVTRCRQRKPPDVSLADAPMLPGYEDIAIVASAALPTHRWPDPDNWSTRSTNRGQANPTAF
jgi:hypothetical protein